MNSRQFQAPKLRKAKNNFLPPKFFFGGYLLPNAPQLKFVSTCLGLKNCKIVGNSNRVNKFFWFYSLLLVRVRPYYCSKSQFLHSWGSKPSMLGKKHFIGCLLSPFINFCCSLTVFFSGNFVFFGNLKKGLFDAYSA